MELNPISPKPLVVYIRRKPGCEATGSLVQRKKALCDVIGP